MPDSIRGNVAIRDDVVEEHFEELSFLSGQLASAIRDPRYVGRSYGELKNRCAAHLDGLLVGGARSTPILGAALAGEEPVAIYVAALASLESRDPLAARAVLAALEGAQEEPNMAGLVKALCQGPLDQTLPSLETWFRTGPPRLAAAAAEVLAYRHKLESRAERLTHLLEDADPLVRRAAWRAAALAG